MNKKVVFCVLVALFAVDIAYGQCSMCRKLAGDATEEMDTSIGRQLNNGILYLMAVPYVLLFVAFRKKIFSFLKELRGAGER